MSYDMISGTRYALSPKIDCTYASDLRIQQQKVPTMEIGSKKKKNEEEEMCPWKQQTW